MKQVTLTFLLLCGFLALDLYAQKPDTTVIPSYPFGEKGTAGRGFYGVDNRQDVTEAKGYEELVDATIVMVPKSQVKGDRIYTYSLKEKLKNRFGVSNFDPNVKFLDQPTCGMCTGFLIAQDMVVTAGHCAEIANACEDYVWVLDYTNKLKHIDNQDYVIVDPNDIYTCEQMLDWELDDASGLDYAFLRLDRKTNREPYRFRTGGEIEFWQDVYMIGAPSGLPLKLADNAYVTGTIDDYFFRTSLDAFPGNSGGPVFDEGGWIEGILVRGDVISDYNNKATGDYMYDASCNCIKTVNFASTYGREGAHVQRIDWSNYDLLKQAIYENLEHAIVTKNDESLNRWLVYTWMVESDFTVSTGRLDLLAAQTNNLNALKAVMDLCKERNSTDAQGKNLIYLAAENNNANMVNYLLEHGVNPNKEDVNGISPLYVAARDNNLSIAYILLDYASPELVNKQVNGGNLLHMAAARGDLDFATRLLKSGADIFATNANGYDAYKVAKKAKQKAMKKFLKKEKKLRK